MSPANYVEPSLFDDLEAAVATVRDVAPDLFSRAHAAGQLVVQAAGGHFAMESLPDRPTGAATTPRCGSWAFLNLGAVLGVLTCRIHGNTIDPARARTLAGELSAWADRVEGGA